MAGAVAALLCLGAVFMPQPQAAKFEPPASRRVVAQALFEPPSKASSMVATPKGDGKPNQPRSPPPRRRLFRPPTSDAAEPVDDDDADDDVVELM